MSAHQDERLESRGPLVVNLDRPLRVLDSDKIQQIDDALADLGPYAEVRLIKNKGRLRFIQRVDSTSFDESRSDRGKQ